MAGKGLAVSCLKWLTVMTHNSRAIALYKKMGFTIEGLKKHSMKVDGRYVDEYLMAKIYEDQ